MKNQRLGDKLTKAFKELKDCLDNNIPVKQSMVRVIRRKGKPPIISRVEFIAPLFKKQK